jgi:hypothetical protein
MHESCAGQRGTMFSSSKDKIGILILSATPFYFTCKG